MQHAIDSTRAGPHAAGMIKAVESCIHCGYCLPTCPTYSILGEEMNSPRGRIILMKETLEGRLSADEAKGYVDCCLGCLACETSCPSGVRYGELLSPFRAWAEHRRTRSLVGRLRRAILLAAIPRPGLFRLGVSAGRLARPFRRVIPAAFRPMLDLVPDRTPEAFPLQDVYPAKGPRRARVALLAGCAQQVLSPGINRATLRVLQENGVEVLIPRGQGCCGALAMHVGAEKDALASARRNLRAFPTDVDAILTNASGCGSGLREYALLFQGQPEEEQARRFVALTADICVFLDKLGLAPPPAAAREVLVAYHDACHLAHAQKVRTPPRRLLSQVPGLRLVEPAEWELCCGSAGTYNLEQPGNADALGRRKAENLLATGAELIATGNIGCLTQIDAHLRRLGRQVPIVHTVEVLARAYERSL
jgi:glycolate oxidase iron-sulfur subunit